MQFDPWKCPECDQPATGTVEVVHGVALLIFDDEGHAEYAGETKAVKNTPARISKQNWTWPCANPNAAP